MGVGVSKLIMLIENSNIILLCYIPYTVCWKLAVFLLRSAVYVCGGDTVDSLIAPKQKGDAASVCRPSSWRRGTTSTCECEKKKFDVSQKREIQLAQNPASVSWGRPWVVVADSLHYFIISLYSKGVAIVFLVNENSSSITLGFGQNWFSKTFRCLTVRWTQSSAFKTTVKET